MIIDPITMARARHALHKATRGWLFDPNVNMIGIGYPEHEGQLYENELAIRVHVHEKLSGLALETARAAGYTHPIPSVIDGFQTDVLQATYRLHQWQSWRSWWRPTTNTNERVLSADPMRGGISISDEFHLASGTLGGKVYDRTTGEEMILSNWHVLAADWRARHGQLIFQPGRLDGGTSANVSAYLTRDAMAANLDAAVATLTGRRRLLNEQLGIGTVTGVRSGQLGETVIKSGRSSFITYGRIVEVDSMVRMPYGYLERLIRNVIVIEPWNGGEVSRPGDSGSWWLNMSTKEVVGLHFAGTDMPERALALDMPTVMKVLNVEIRV